MDMKELSAMKQDMVKHNRRKWDRVGQDGKIEWGRSGLDRTLLETRE